MHRRSTRFAGLITSLIALFACATFAGTAQAANSGNPSVAAEHSGGSFGTNDFFECDFRVVVQERYFEGRWIHLERCWSQARGTYMYRGNIWFPRDGDQLRVAYAPVGQSGFVPGSFRAAPANRDQWNEMPGEWYLAGGVNGSEIQACLTIPGYPEPYYCSWP
jgi:hypothetical protein